MKKLIFLLIIIFCLVFFGIQIINGYLGNHEYYFNMFSNTDNILIFIYSIIFSLVPILYIFFSKQRNFIFLLVYIFIGLGLFGLFFIGTKAGLLGGGWFIFLLNSFVIFSFMVLFILGLLFFGEIIKNKLLKFSTENIFGVLLSFAIGLSVFLLFNYILLILGLFYSIISWIFFGILMFCIYYNKNKFKSFQDIVFSSFGFLNDFFSNKSYERILSYFGVLLLILSVAYFYYGFLLSFIPYPTAWDANHAYIFNPKMWALNNGFYWGGEGIGNSSQLWYGYLTYIFSLFLPFESFFWLSADTFAIMFNFLSGIFVLFITIALIKEIVNYIFSESDGNEGFNNKIAFYFGWFLVLLWLTSGMGAFLVFVDNKTDLGVLSLVVIAIYSGFVGLKTIKDKDGEKHPSEESYTKNNKSYIYKLFGVSGFLFAIAVMGKPTALLDAVGFVFLLSWLWIGIIAVVGGFLLIIGLLSFIDFRGINDYISSGSGYVIFIIGLLSSFIGTIKTFFKNSFFYLYVFFIWLLVFVITILIFKGPFEYIKYVNSDDTFKPLKFIENVYLTNNYKENKDFDELYVANNFSQLNNNSCSLKNIDNKKKELYGNLKEPPGNTRSEDVGRYVGYGNRNFKNPWWGFIFPGSNYCVGPNEAANIVCENKDLLNNPNKQKLKQLKEKLPKNSILYEELSKFLDSSSKNNISTNTGIVQKLQDSYEGSSIVVENTCMVGNGTQDIPKRCKNVKEKDKLDKGQIRFRKNISIPYNYLIPFNITFNWSLQNTSSYYTDIGYIWLIAKILLIVAFIYGIVSLNKFLIGITGVSILLWIIWFFIGGGILWYGMGILIWTIISLVTFINELGKDLRNQEHYNQYLYYVLLVILFLFCISMVLLNYIRISSYGGSKPFVWYKQSVGKVNKLDNNLRPKSSIEIPYTKEDIFDLQFAHYNKFLEAANNRDKDEGVFLAGTYARYFIKDQMNIKYDQKLTWLWKMFSDENVCKSYLRMKDKNVDYIAIDPNIGTVVQGEGNISLFNRFFAKVNKLNGTIEQHGVISMLSKMFENGYVEYLHSNNIGAKYAYTISDDMLEKHISEVIGSNVSDEQLTFIRSRMAVARYERYWQNDYGISQVITNILHQRIQNGKAIKDIADVLGVDIDYSKLQTIISNNGVKLNPNKIKNLSDDDKRVLSNYLNLLRMSRKNKQQYKQSLQRFVGNSVGSSSQIIVLEVRD